MSDPFPHFAMRVAERIGEDINALHLFQGLTWAVENDRQDLVQFVARVNRSGRRLWRFSLPEERTFYMIFDHKIGLPITVLVPGQSIGRHPDLGGGHVKLPDIMEARPKT